VDCAGSPRASKRQALAGAQATGAAIFLLAKTQQNMPGRKISF
jgi:hypothetical protein